MELSYNSSQKLYCNSICHFVELTQLTAQTTRTVMAPVLVTRHPQKVFITAILQPLLVSTHFHSVNSGLEFNGVKIA